MEEGGKGPGLCSGKVRRSVGQGEALWCGGRRRTRTGRCRTFDVACFFLPSSPPPLAVRIARRSSPRPLSRRRTLSLSLEHPVFAPSALPSRHHEPSASAPPSPTPPAVFAHSLCPPCRSPAASAAVRSLVRPPWSSPGQVDATNFLPQPGERRVQDSGAGDVPLLPSLLCFFAVLFLHRRQGSSTLFLLFAPPQHPLLVSARPPRRQTTPNSHPAGACLLLELVHPSNTLPSTPPSMFTHLFTVLAVFSLLDLTSASSPHAREVAKSFEHQELARRMSEKGGDGKRIEKRYPPDRETFIPTTTPAWMVSSTAAASPTSSSSSTTSPAAGATTTSPPSGQFATPTSRALVAATTSSATTCASAYVAPTMITGTGTLPKPTSFVRKKVSRGQALVGDGNLPYVIVGPNIYWLCQDENYGPLGSYTDKGRVREALAIAVAMGANTVRPFSPSFIAAILTCSPSRRFALFHAASRLVPITLTTLSRLTRPSTTLPFVLSRRPFFLPALTSSSLAVRHP